MQIEKINLIPNIQKPRLAWSLYDIHDLTGLSVNFLRYEVRRGNLKTRKFGRRVLVLNADLQNYLEKGSEGKK